MKRKRNWKKRLVLSAVILGSLYGLGYGFVYWDPTRTLWLRVKRMKDPYRFEKINPRYLKTDPAKLITIGSPEDAVRVRGDLIDAVYGAAGLPLEELPTQIERDIPLGANADPTNLGAAFYKDMENLAGIDRVTVTIDEKFGHKSKFFHFRPKTGNKGLVIYQNGFGGTGTFHDKKEILAALIKKGYAVMAFNLPGVGENVLGETYLPRFGWYALHTWRLLDLVERPMRYWFKPITVAVNYARKAYAYDNIDMIGFSAGGWTAMVASALENRIRRSYPVAGGYPLYLRSGDEEKQSPQPQYYAPMIRAANYLEMFILASLGKDRRQLQIFNRYDRCCYNNTKGKLYEQAVKDALARAGEGRFDVLIDETHARHKISSYALDAILKDMAQP